MEIELEVPASFAPVVLHPDRLTDDEFLEFCQEHEDLQVESNEKGELELMPPAGPGVSGQNLDFAMQLAVWAKKDKRGKAFDSSALFVLPSGARRSPDGSWISKERIATLPKSQVDRLWHICPEFVVELRSPSDRKPRLREKMLEWIANGAQLGWLIEPKSRTVTVYRPAVKPEILRKPKRIRGEWPVEGFVLDLTTIWEEII